MEDIIKLYSISEIIYKKYEFDKCLNKENIISIVIYMFKFFKKENYGYYSKLDEHMAKTMLFEFLTNLYNQEKYDTIYFFKKEDFRFIEFFEIKDKISNILDDLNYYIKNT